MNNEGLQEDDIQNLQTTPHEQLTDQELLLSTISTVDLPRKHSGVWDKENPSVSSVVKHTGSGLLPSSVT
jgi:hypothetical protein